MSLTKVTYPMISSASETSPVYNESSNSLYRVLGFDNGGVTTTIPASKQYNYIGIRNGGSENQFSIGNGGEVAGLTYYIRSTSTSNANSNMYAVVGNLYNSGPGVTKALYGRAIAESGCTGVVMGAVLRTQVDTGATPSASWCLQIGPAGPISRVADVVIQIDHEQGTVGSPGKVEYGLLQNPNIQFTEAMVRGINGGGGDFLRWQSSSAILFTVNDAGDVETETKFKVSTTELSSESLKRTATGGNFGIHLDNAGTLYIGGTSPSTAPLTTTNNAVNIIGTVGTLNFASLSSASAGALVGYINIKVDGTLRKIPYYAES